MSELQRTALHTAHLNLKAKMVPFSGFEMPIHYGSQIEEHHAVRKNSGLFDVSHMLVSEISGPEATLFLSYLLANDVHKLSPGKALYTCLLNHQGGIIDDLIIYHMPSPSKPTENSDTPYYRLVTNAGTREKDLTWIRQQAKPYQVTVSPCPNLSILALQGPESVKKITQILEQDLPTTSFTFCFDSEKNLLIARTGYTGEFGFEIILPHQAACLLWEDLIKTGVHPCGLGARDTLRLEAGMNLYGQDMTEATTPFETGLGWTVSLKNKNNHPREFIGRAALEKQKNNNFAKPHDIQIGLILEDKGGLLRAHQAIFSTIDSTTPCGEITSGGFSPTLNQSIGLARVRPDLNNQNQNQNNYFVDIRGKRLKAKITTLPFVRKN